MEKLLHGVVFALPADEEYSDMAHLWVRDAETAYWFLCLVQSTLTLSK